MLMSGGAVSCFWHLRDVSWLVAIYGNVICIGKRYELSEQPDINLNQLFVYFAKSREPFGYRSVRLFSILTLATKRLATARARFLSRF